MKLFTAVILGLLSSCQGQRNHENGFFLGLLHPHFEGVSGSLSSLGPYTLEAGEFALHRPTEGERLRFYCGINGRPSPFGLRFGPPLTRTYDKETLILDLPRGCRSDKLKWISVWSESLEESFADLVFKGPEGFQEDEDLDSLLLGGGRRRRTRGKTNRRRLVNSGGSFRNVVGLSAIRRLNAGRRGIYNRITI